ncbi:hypothetical protein HUJ04_002760 [Dendroctonus ponderosae]|nr:hypothetical protein HUJ04_002760 [Dendroctonus ponderosae]KAH1024300.1 hypothetical protein HUJ05_003803 [Dendroctonus ponderosae]
MKTKRCVQMRRTPRLAAKVIKKAPKMYVLEAIIWAKQYATEPSTITCKIQAH